MSFQTKAAGMSEDGVLNALDFKDQILFIYFLFIQALGFLEPNYYGGCASELDPVWCFTVHLITWTFPSGWQVTQWHSNLFHDQLILTQESLSLEASAVTAPECLICLPILQLSRFPLAILALSTQNKTDKHLYLHVSAVTKRCYHVLVKRCFYEHQLFVLWIPALGKEN